METPVWRAFYVKPRHELKVKERLLESGHEIYCPCVKEKVRWSDRWKKVTKPVLNGYIFGRVSEKERIRVLEDPGVVRSVCWLGKPAVIRDEEIEAMKILLERGQEVTVDHLKAGDEVIVAHGTLKGQSGMIVRLDNGEAFVRLESLQCIIRARIPVVYLET